MQGIKANLVLIAFILITMSCVVNRQYQYLQHDDVNPDFGELAKDTVVRSYKLSDFEYKLQPEDILSIQFFSLTEAEVDFFSLKGGNKDSNFNQFQNGAASLVNGYLIDEKGEIEFPVVGKVNLAGLTVFEAQTHLRDVAKEYLDEAPMVEVRLLNFRFTILGEVGREGTIGSINNRITMLEAIGLSGGFTDLADKSNVKVIRQGKEKAEVYYINLLSEEFLSSPHYYMNQNDVLIVPPLKQRPYQIYFSKNLSLVLSSTSLLLVVINLLSR